MFLSNENHDKFTWNYNNIKFHYICKCNWINLLGNVALNLLTNAYAIENNENKDKL